mmetsp:Transcript_3772/g.12199  ORF Transcript_3772/g.12199 Transcript_3772/m.12199 type:complete len:240 (-) Transcript_3772:185-904(-)
MLLWISLCSSSFRGPSGAAPWAAISSSWRPEDMASRTSLCISFRSVEEMLSWSSLCSSFQGPDRAVSRATFSSFWRPEDMASRTSLCISFRSVEEVLSWSSLGSSSRAHWRSISRAARSARRPARASRLSRTWEAWDSSRVPWRLIVSRTLARLLSCASSSSPCLVPGRLVSSCAHLLSISRAARSARRLAMASRPSWTREPWDSSRAPWRSTVSFMRPTSSCIASTAMERGPLTLSSS